MEGAPSVDVRRSAGGRAAIRSDAAAGLAAAAAAAAAAPDGPWIDVVPAAHGAARAASSVAGEAATKATADRGCLRDSIVGVRQRTSRVKRGGGGRDANGEPTGWRVRK